MLLLSVEIYKTDRQTDRDRETDRQTDRQTDIQRQRNRQTDGEIYTHIDRQTNKQTDRQRCTETERHTHIQTDSSKSDCPNNINDHNTTCYIIVLGCWTVILKLFILNTTFWSRNFFIKNRTVKIKEGIEHEMNNRSTVNSQGQRIYHCVYTQTPFLYLVHTLDTQQLHYDNLLSEDQAKQSHIRSKNQATGKKCGEKESEWERRGWKEGEGEGMVREGGEGKGEGEGEGEEGGADGKGEEKEREREVEQMERGRVIL